jgi:prepilin-type N-terminal cleavage/methylation domain-containing protein
MGNKEDKTPNKNKGFTLIELLVVISIIGLLASVVLASLNTARAKARDAKLLSELNTLTTALGLYYNDHGSYPPFNDPEKLYPAPKIANIIGDKTNIVLKNALSPYLSEMPTTPMVSNPNYKGGVSISRITYSRPYILNWQWRSGMAETCGGGKIWGFTGKCYTLTIMTETDTSLGPAETPIEFLNGTDKIVYPPSGVSGSWWGSW